jgi:hypothetical protein
MYITNSGPWDSQNTQSTSTSCITGGTTTIVFRRIEYYDDVPRLPDQDLLLIAESGRPQTTPPRTRPEWFMPEVKRARSLCAANAHRWREYVRRRRFTAVPVAPAVGERREPQTKASKKSSRRLPHVQIAQGKRSGKKAL